MESDRSDHVDAILATDAAGKSFVKRQLKAAVQAKPGMWQQPCSTANGELCTGSPGGCVLKHWAGTIKRDALSYRMHFKCVLPSSHKRVPAKLSIHSPATEASATDRWIDVRVDRQTGVCELTFGVVGSRYSPFTDDWLRRLRVQVGSVPVTRLPAKWVRERGELVGIGDWEVPASDPDAADPEVLVNDARVRFGVNSLERVLQFMLWDVAHALACKGVTSSKLFDEQKRFPRVFMPLEFYGAGVDREKVVGLVESRLVRGAHASSTSDVPLPAVTYAATFRHATCSVLMTVPSGKSNAKIRTTGYSVCPACLAWSRGLAVYQKRHADRMTRTTVLPLPAGKEVTVGTSNAPGVVSATMGARIPQVRLCHCGWSVRLA